MLRKRQSARNNSAVEEPPMREPACRIEPKRLKLSPPSSKSSSPTSSGISYSGSPYSVRSSRPSHRGSSMDSNNTNPSPPRRPSSLTRESGTPISPFVPPASNATPTKPRNVCSPIPPKRPLDMTMRSPPQGASREKNVSWRPSASSRELGNGDLSPGRLGNEGVSPGRDLVMMVCLRGDRGATMRLQGDQGMSLSLQGDPMAQEVVFLTDQVQLTPHSTTQQVLFQMRQSTRALRGEEESNGGIVNVLTRFISGGVKKILGHIRDQGLSRLPLHPTKPAPGDSPPSTSPPESECRLGASAPSGEVDSSYPRSSSPTTSGHSLSGSSAQQSSGPSSSSTHTYDWEIQAADVEICTKPDGSFLILGRGGFGEVFKGLKDGVDEVAVKVIKLSHPEVVSQFKEEIELISKLRHRNIVQFYGACIQPSSLYMVTELMETDLFSALRRDQRYLWAGTHGRSVASGVASGLHYLHSRKPPVVHRDIKSPNILLMGGVAKIADVGVARTKANMDMTAQKGFTAAWAAPEVVFRRRATEKIDVWSFGVVLWEIVTGNVPKPGQLVLPSWCSGALRNLYSSCTSEDPTARPSAGKIVQDLRLIQ
eukprot:Em0022g516a